MIRVAILRNKLKEWQEFFILVSWDAFLKYGTPLTPYWSVEFQEELLDNIYIYSPDDDLYKIELGKIEQNPEYIFVEYVLYQMVPNGWVEI